MSSSFSFDLGRPAELKSLVFFPELRLIVFLLSKYLGLGGRPLYLSDGILGEDLLDVTPITDLSLKYELLIIDALSSETSPYELEDITSISSPVFLLTKQCSRF